MQEKMKKRSAKASSKLPVPVSLLPFPSLSPHSPTRKSYNPSSILRPSSRSMKKAKPPCLSPPSPLVHCQSPPQKAVAKISDLKDLAASRLHSINQQTDLFHAEILKEIDTAKSRLSKRFQIQSQACLQIAAEAEKENKKLSDWINGNMGILKASHAEFITETQASASRVFKVSIPEIKRSTDKAIEELRCRCRVPSSEM